jgi:hypothetical protein
MKKVVYKFEIGQTVRVTGAGYQYSSWDAKAQQMGLRKWKENGGLRCGQNGEIVARDIHDDCRTRIYGITCEDGSQHIIGEDGLESYSGTLTPQSPTITISRVLLGEYYDAATNQQRKYLIDNFKLNGDTTVDAIVGLYNMACDKWKPIIKKNHPECFPEENKYFDLSHLTERRDTNRIFTDEQAEKCGFSDAAFFQVRGIGEYKGKGFYLDNDYNWEIVKDSVGHLVLVPTKKSK